MFHRNKIRNLTLRLIIACFFCFPFIFFRKFYDHFYAYLTGNVYHEIIKKQWDIVVLSIVLFLLFLIPLSFRRKIKWTEYGFVTAFFVSLFIEMYGFPFSILFAQKWFYQASISHPASVLGFNLFGTHFKMDFPMAYAAMLLIIGALLIILGWITLYFGMKRGEIVTNGVYAFSRHPQYLGFIIIIMGWFIGWPTILTVIMSPILIYKYVSVARREEKEVQNLTHYQIYKKTVPFLI